jgi:hypothetical protein
MKRVLALLQICFFLLAPVVRVSAQGAQVARPIPRVSTLPATCTQHDLVQYTGASNPGLYICGDSNNWIFRGGSGNVSSVGLVAPSVFSVANSPVTTAGNLTLDWAGGQTANRVLAAPDGSSGQISLRALVVNDLPGSIPYSKLSLSGAILNADLAGSIDATKLHNGSVSNTEFGHLDGVTSALQTQLDAKQALDARLTALAALNSTAGLLEQTGAASFTKRAIGISASTDIPTRADADARYAALSHTHAQSDITNLLSDLAAKAPTSRTISVGAGLSGGGDLSANRTISLNLNASGGLVSNLGGGTNELGIGTGGVTNAMLAGSIALSKLSITGTPDGTKYLRDDGSWQAVNAGTTINSTNGQLPYRVNATTFGDSAISSNALNQTGISVTSAAAGAGVTVGVTSSGTNEDLILAGKGTGGIGIGLSTVLLQADAANTLAQRNGTNAQKFRLYETYTDAGNYSRFRIEANNGVNEMTFGPEAAGTGTARNLVIDAPTGVIRFARTGIAYRWQINGNGHILAEADNTYDIGASGAYRPRHGYFSGTITTGALLSNDYVALGTSSRLDFASRSRIRSPADGTLLLLNAAETDFDRLQFACATSSCPALKRSSATLQVRLADDSGFADLSAARHFAADGTASAPSYSFNVTNTLGFYRIDATTIGVAASSGGGQPEITLGTNISLRDIRGLFWSSTGSAAGAADLGLTRATARVLNLSGGASAGTLRAVPDSPAQITADQNNYAAGTGRSLFYRLSTDASRNITGFNPAGGTNQDGELHYFINVGSFDIVLKHEDAASTAANRFLNSTGADLTLTANQTALLVYDGTSARWRVFKQN